MYEYCNLNPHGLRVGDCVVRAISKALGQTWETTYDDGYSEDWIGDGRMYGASYARGRRGNVKRDQMGRYSRDDGDYSRGDAKEHMLDKLGEMMESADPNEREALKRAMREIERA